MELRFVFDCENLKQILQFREKTETGEFTSWQNVPVIYGIISDEKVVSIEE
jgi:hypothetical protein